MITYILQAILFQLLFLLVYEVLLKKETFFSYNRWYLLITAVLSLLLPFIQIEALSILFPETTLTQIPTIFLPEVYIGGESAIQSLQQIPANETGSAGSILNWWPGIYLIGVLGALFIVLKKYNNLSRMFRFKKDRCGRKDHHHRSSQLRYRLYVLQNHFFGRSINRS